MIYSQIITFLFVILVLYYAGMIAMDLHKAKKMKEIESENVTENDIDISDEAKNFKTIFISREDQNKHPVENTRPVERVKTRIPREAAMSGGLPVETLTEKIRNSNGALPEDLGNILHKCQAV